MRRVGAYGSENYSLMAALKKWANKKGLFEDSVIYGIAQDNPATTLPEQCRYDVCLIISDDSAVNDDVIKGESPSGKYAVFTVIHTIEAVHEFYGSFMNILQENKLQYDMEKPILERYKYKLVENGQCEFCIPIL